MEGRKSLFTVLTQHTAWALDSIFLTNLKQLFFYRESCHVRLCNRSEVTKRNGLYKLDIINIWVLASWKIDVLLLAINLLFIETWGTYTLTVTAAVEHCFLGRGKSCALLHPVKPSCVAWWAYHHSPPEQLPVKHKLCTVPPVHTLHPEGTPTGIAGAQTQLYITVYNSCI